MVKAIGPEYERSSPFFVRNKQASEQFEQDLKTHGASVNGSYGAWAFKCKAIFKDFPETTAEFEKSTYTRDTWSLFKSVYNLSVWTINTPVLDSKIKVRKSKFIDFLGLTGFKKTNEIIGYRIKQKGNNVLNNKNIVKVVLESIAPAIKAKDIYLIVIEKNTLTIKFESTNSYTSLLINLREKIKNYTQQAL